MRILFSLLFLFNFSFIVQAQFESGKRKVNISAVPNNSPKQKANVAEKTTKSIFPEIKLDAQLIKKTEDKFSKFYPEIPKVGENQKPKIYPLKVVDASTEVIPIVTLPSTCQNIFDAVAPPVNAIVVVLLNVELI